MTDLWSLDELVIKHLLSGPLSLVIVPALCFLAAWGLRGIVFLVATAWLRRQDLLPPQYDLRRHFRPFILLALFLILLWPSSYLMAIPKGAEDEFRKGLQVASIAVGTWLLVKGVHLARAILFHRFNTDGSDNLRQRKARTQIDYVAKVLDVALAFVGFCFILMTFDGARRIGASLVTSAGLVGLVVGFAAQRTLGNVIAGFSIAFTQPLRLDDVVVVEKEWGRIEEISLTYVVVRLWDWRRLVLPITYFVEKPFENWTRTSARIIGQVQLWLDFHAPLDALRARLAEIVKASPLWDKDVAVLQVVDATERTMQVRVLVSAANSGDAFDLRCLVREGLIAFLRDRYPEALPRVRLDGASFRDDGGDEALRPLGEADGKSAEARRGKGRPLGGLAQ